MDKETAAGDRPFVNDKRRILALLMVMALVAMAISGSSIYILYRAAFEEQRARLTELAKNQARLMESVARFDALHGGYDDLGGARAATISQIVDAHKYHDGIGKTGEFVIAELQGGTIRFLLKAKHIGDAKPGPVSMDGALAEPMRRVLSGQSGTVVGPDYRGVIVLAAYEPVKHLNIGLVAKIDLSELRAPYLRAAGAALGGGLIILFLGLVAIRLIARPFAERQRTLTALAEREDRLKQVLENAVDAIVTIDEGGLILSFNPAAEKMFGYATAEVKGRNVSMLMPEPYHSEHDQYLAWYLRTAEARIIGKGREVKGRRKNGSTFAMDLAVSEFHSGGQRMFTGIIRDVTEKKQAEEKISRFARNADLTRRLTTAANEAKTLDDLLEKWLKELCDYTQHDIGHAYWGSPDDDDALFPRQAWHLADEAGDRKFKHITMQTMPTRGSGMLGKALDAGKPLWVPDLGAEPDFRRRGVAIDLGLKSAMLYPVASGGRILGILEFFSRSDRRQDDEIFSVIEGVMPQLCLAIERIEAQKNMRRARDEAEAANRAKSEFLSRMSHELRTPMNAILGFGQLLEMDTEQALTVSQDASVAHILKAGNHLLRLIDEVLDLSKIDAGKLSVSLEKVVVHDVVEHSVSLLSRQADQRDIAITTRIPADLAVRADRDRLQQVLVNLLSNAVKYNNKGGSVSVEYATSGDGFARIGITDTGAGIPDHLHGELFLPFHRLEAENSEVEGTGIGLTITKRLVELMDGRIGMESTIGKGSTFWIELPVATAKDDPIPPADLVDSADPADLADLADPADPADDAPAPPFDPKPPANGSRKVLYVEDNPANLKLMEMVLKQVDGIELVSAGNAELGIEMAERGNPDLIILDINLPGMDGFEALKRLRSMTATCNTPVVALSANAMPKDVERGRRAGFLDYLTKPVDVQELLRVIHGTLDRERQEEKT